MMKILRSDLEQMAGRPDQYPGETLPEFALAGRSNVGKSSFINRFCFRKRLAYTSQTPGKTRTVNFYRINDSFRLVDLPGYGFARVSKAEQDLWAERIHRYLTERENLLQVFLVVDSRHEPSAGDVKMMEWIRASHFPPLVLCSKLDKIPRTKQAAALKKIRNTLGVDDDHLFPFSAQSGQGIERVQDLVATCLKSAEDRKE